MNLNLVGRCAQAVGRLLGGKHAEMRQYCFGTRIAFAGGMTAYRQFWGLVLGLSTIACQTNLERYPTDPDSTSLIVAKFAYGQTPTVFLLVVDDANSLEAAELRQRVTQSVRGGLLHEYVEGRQGCNSRDPAQWQPVDMRIVVARPSAPEEETLFTPTDLPSLAWVTNNAVTNDIDSVGNATLEALEKRLAQPGETFRPLRTASRIVDLMMRQRAPMNDSENEFLTSLPESYAIHVLIAGTRDDADNLPVEQLQPKADYTDFVFPEYVVVGPTNTSDSSCLVYPLGNSRLERWTEPRWESFHAWPCSNDESWDELLRGFSLDCGPICFGHAIDVSPGGVAPCRIFIDQLDLTACTPTNGWKDPDHQPQFVEQYGMKTRRCEIEQHTGTNLDACRHSYECPDCPSGFCVTEVPEIGFSGPGCGGNDVPWSIRFTGGAVAANPAWVTMMCDTGIR